MDLQEKTAIELSLDDKIFYINRGNGDFSYEQIKNLKLRVDVVEIELITDSLAIAIGEHNSCVRKEDIIYYSNEREWIGDVIPLQEKRVEEKALLLQDSKNYLKSLKEKLK